MDSDTREYYEQLKTINQMIKDCPESTDKSELLSLKQNIEELITLTEEVTTHSITDHTNTTSTSEQEKQNLGTDINEQKVNAGPSADLDEEYALFMAELAKEEEEALETPEKDKSLKESPSLEKTSEKPKLIKNSESFKYLEGKKFRAPHKHQWGQVVYHNAMVCSVPENTSEDDEFQVKVLFLNPTHKEMQPCPYYFHLEKDCNYSDEECGYSHGESVPYSSLQEYVEPKFELLTIGSDVLAKQTNNLWYRAKITRILKGKCLVKFDSKNVDNQSFEEIIFAHILPLERSEDDSENGSEEDEEDIGDFDAQLETDRLEAKRRHEELINMSLMNVPDSQRLGDWEKYTKGIGSKLMQKMGYVVGTGLGKRGSGIIKPVKALILPAGKSLDFCMNLKEKHNNPDLFSADTNGQKKSKPAKKRSRGKSKHERRVENSDFVKYLNFRYSPKVNKNRQFPKTGQKEFQTMKEKLTSGTDKDLYLSNYVVEDKMEKYRVAIEKLKLLNKKLIDSDPNGILYKRLCAREIDLKELATYNQMVKNEMDRRKNNKEMAVF